MAHMLRLSFQRLILPFSSALGFDRDLGLAGRAMVKTEDGTIVQKLLHLDRPSELLTFCHDIEENIDGP